MMYPSVSDVVFPNIWLEDSSGTKYPVRYTDGGGEFDIPNGVKATTAHCCFPLEVSESMYETDNNGHYGGKDHIATFNTTMSYLTTNLVLALSRPKLSERIKSILRTKRIMPLVDLDQAMLQAVMRCERCCNSLAYAYGLNWGYPAFSELWKMEETNCEACLDQLTDAEKMEKALR